MPPIASQTFQASVAQVRLDQSTSRPFTNTNIDASAGASGSVTLARDATADTWTFANGTGSLNFSYTFRASDEVGDDGTILEYQQVSGNRTLTLDIFDPGSTNSILPLTYVSYANLLIIDNNGSSATGQARTAVGGIKTVTLPTSGTQTYNAVVDGLVIPNQGSYRPLGLSTATITVDFATGTISGTLQLIANDDPSGLRRGTDFNFGTYSISGSFTPGTNSYALNIQSPGGQFGAVYGNFFGPSAEEIGMSIAINDTTANNPVVALSLVGKR